LNNLVTTSDHELVNKGVLLNLNSLMQHRILVLKTPF